MKVVVRLNNGKSFTYDAPDNVKVRDLVELPKPFFMYESEPNPVGLVTALESEYDGELRSIVGVVGHEEEEKLEFTLG